MSIHLIRPDDRDRVSAYIIKNLCSLIQKSYAINERDYDTRLASNRMRSVLYYKRTPGPIIFDYPRMSNLTVEDLATIAGRFGNKDYKEIPGYGTLVALIHNDYLNDKFLLEAINDNKYYDEHVEREYALEEYIIGLGDAPDYAKIKEHFPLPFTL